MNHDPIHSKNTDPDWIESNVNLIIGGLVLACAATLIAEVICRPFFDDHHPAHFELENVFGFQAAFGFVAFVVVVFLGRLLRVFIRRDEDYYDT